MSRKRIVNKLRSQPWFADVSRYLDGRGIGMAVQGPSRSGHPKVILTLQDGREITQGIPCTPRQAQAPAQQVARVRRTIDAAELAALTGDIPPRAARSAWTPERIACLTRGVNPLEGMSRGTGQTTGR